jgi:selenocysteine lyase/cysteine desulfurase
MDVERLRAETPGCERRVHLNNAGASLMPAPVLAALQDHIDLESKVGGYEAEAARAAAITEAYAAVARLVGAAPHNIAMTESATASYTQALSSIPLEHDDVVLTTQNDYISNQIHFLSLQKRIGIRVVRAPDTPAGGVDVAAMGDLIRERRPKIVCVTHVPTNSGLVQDVAAIGAICRAEDVWYLVDACQSVGQMPVDAGTIGCDFLSATSRKWLRGPRGAGFLFVSDRVLDRGLEPLFIDMRGAEWIGADEYRPVDSARRFETWEFAWALVLGTGAAAAYAHALGLDQIRARVRLLADLLRDLLGEMGIRVLDRGRERCGIVSVWLGDRDPVDVMNLLRARGINTTAQVRAYAVMDYDAKGITSSLRFSPHYYNTEEEIDRALAALQDVLEEARTT